MNFYLVVVMKCQENVEDLNDRLGLLGTSLGLDPLGSVAEGKNKEESDMSAPLLSLDDPFESVPDEMLIPDDSDINMDNVEVSVENFENKNNASGGGVLNFVNSGNTAPSDKFTDVGEQASDRAAQCCCIPQQDICPDPLGIRDLVNTGIIDDRLEEKEKQVQDTSNSLTFRIAPNELESTSTCPLGLKACCYEPDLNLEAFGVSCLSPEEAQSPENWKQGCEEREDGPQDKQCGLRNFQQATNLLQDEASPGEFPWTCMILTLDNGFVGNCVLIPDREGFTEMVLTAAHKLNKITDSKQLKVRVGDYDASGFKKPETSNYKEYPVKNLVKHPKFNRKRLSNDIAILFTVQEIDLSHPYVNTACLPSCEDQFSFQFPNTTGVSCWVSGWGTNRLTKEFQPVQHKLNLPLVDPKRCQKNLRKALNELTLGVGDRFVFSTSEICAGGDNQDACAGDGGSPLVCQAVSGRWTVVGLVTWGVGCKGDVPGVYANIAEAKAWIDSLRKS